MTIARPVQSSGTNRIHPGSPRLLAAAVLRRLAGTGPDPDLRGERPCIFVAVPGGGDGFTISELRALAGQASCPVTACAAGWAVIAGADDSIRLGPANGVLVTPGNDTLIIHLLARELLGLGPESGRWLLSHDRARGQVLAGLQAVAAGRPVQYPADPPGPAAPGSGTAAAAGPFSGFRPATGDVPHTGRKRSC